MTEKIVFTKRSWRTILAQPPSRRETLLFGLLLLEVFWLINGARPRTVVTIPDEAVRVGHVIT